MNNKSEKLAAGDSLKACPFCGDNHSTPHPFVTGDMANYIQCDNIYCGASGPPSANINSAKKAWNRRVPEQQPNVEKLRALLIRARRNVEHSATHPAGAASRELLTEIDAALSEQEEK